MKKYSVIIPTYNEEENVEKLISHLINFKENLEIIICDGGSTDNTFNYAQKYDVKIYSDKRGRGRQLNFGAEKSSGEILIFLHADTFLPSNAFELLNNYFKNEKNKITTFRLRFDENNLLMRIYSFFTRFESVFSTFGDSAIIVRRELFFEMGGFPEQKILEDVEFLRKIRKNTKIRKIPVDVITSARQFRRRGYLLTQLVNAYYLIKFLTGTNSDIIYEKYYNEKKEK
jgi:rSAM/selenodomain-associated transferase 2